MQVVLEARNLYRFYHANEEEVLALRDVSICVQSGEMVAIVGPSGSGKSTLLACLAGTDEPTGGAVHVDGKRMTRRPEAERARIRAETIGFLMQSDNLIEHWTVEENMLFPMQLGSRRDPKRIRALLDALGLIHRRHAYPGQLSGGESARAGLAVALAGDPKIVLADEPTAEVDAETENWVLELLDNYCQGGGALVVATHSRTIAKKASRTIRLLDGKIVSDD